MSDEVIVLQSDDATLFPEPVNTTIYLQPDSETLFLQPDNATIYITEPDPEVILIVGNGGSGPTGPQGPPGPPGGSQFVYVQSVPSSAWVITHNLNSLVHVTLLDGTNTQVEGDVRETNLNVVTIVFNTPQTGTAVISP